MKTIDGDLAGRVIGTSYLDERNRPVVLTDEEKAFFLMTAANVIYATRQGVNVLPADHERLPAHARDALGIHWCSLDSSSEFITIDCYFIHERYRVERCGDYALESQTLAEVICHELAHMRYKNHTKYHAALTAQYVGMYNAFMANAMGQRRATA